MTADESCRSGRTRGDRAQAGPDARSHGGADRQPGPARACPEHRAHDRPPCRLLRHRGPATARAQGSAPGPRGGWAACPDPEVRPQGRRRLCPARRVGGRARRPRAGPQRFRRPRGPRRDGPAPARAAQTCVRDPGAPAHAGAGLDGCRWQCRPDRGRVRRWRGPRQRQGAADLRARAGAAPGRPGLPPRPGPDPARAGALADRAFGEGGTGVAAGDRRAAGGGEGRGRPPRPRPDRRRRAARDPLGRPAALARQRACRP